MVHNDCIIKQIFTLQNYDVLMPGKKMLFNLIIIYKYNELNSKLVRKIELVNNFK